MFRIDIQYHSMKPFIKYLVPLHFMYLLSRVSSELESGDEGGI